MASTCWCALALARQSSSGASEEVGRDATEPRVGVDTDVEAEEVEVEALDSYTLRSRARLTSCGRDMAHSGGGARRALEYRGDGQADSARAGGRARDVNKQTRGDLMPVCRCRG